MNIRRTWEFASSLEATARMQHNDELPDTLVPLFQGTLGNGAGLEFYSFTKISKDLVSYKDIIAEPNSCKIPSDLSAQWSLVGMLISKVKPDDLDPVMTYVKRLPIEFQVIFVQDLAKKDRTIIRSNPALQAWVSQVATKFRS